MTTKKQITFSEARPLLGSIYLSRVLPVLFSGIIQFMQDDLTKMNVLSRLRVGESSGTTCRWVNTKKTPEERWVM